MATYEVEVVQLVSATVTVEATDSEAAIHACYESDVLLEIESESIYTGFNDWVPAPDALEGITALDRDEMLDEYVTRVKD